MVNVVTGSGGWFHNFGGLSTPITMWSDAYYKQGTFSTGFDTWVDRYEFTNENKSFSSDITYFGEKEKFTVIVTMNDDENNEYKVYFDGEEIPFKERFKGTIEISLSVNDCKTHSQIIK